MTQRSHTTANQSLTWCMTVVLISIMLAAAGCNKEQQPQQKGRQTKGPSAVRVQTTTVQKISVQRQVDLAGTLISPDLAKVSSEAPGIVREVLVEIGQEVQPGQILVKLAPREMELALSRAESQLRQTEAQLGIDGSRTEPSPDEEISAVRTAIANRDDAQAQLARAKRLSSQRLLPQADVDTAQTRVKVTEAAYSAALDNVRTLKATLQERRTAVELAQKKLNDCVIKAPVGGSVSERFVQPGEFIRENTPVVSVVQMNPLKLKTSVQERYASLIHPKLNVQFRVESYPGEQFTGMVANISPSIDQTTRTFIVEIVVDNQSRRLKPGFFTKGAILTKTDEVLAVPEDTISTLAGVSTVYVIEKNKARQQIVTLGVREGKLTEIVSGLKGDEVLAASNLNQLATGVSVEPGPSKQADLDEGITARPQSPRQPRKEPERAPQPAPERSEGDQGKLDYNLKSDPTPVITNVTASQESGNVVVAVSTSGSVSHKEYLLSAPSRLVVDLINVENKFPVPTLVINAAKVKQLRIGQSQSADPKITRMVFDLEEPRVSHEILSDNQSVRIVFHAGPARGKVPDSGLAPRAEGGRP